MQIEQKIGGIPGRGTNKKVTQRLYITKERLRLDEAGPDGSTFYTRCLLQSRKDTFLVYELLHKKKSYQVWDEMGNIQEDRDLAERQLLGVLPSEKLSVYHLKEDLERIVEVKRSEGKKLTVDGTDYQCSHVVISENGLVVVDAQVTDKVKYGMDYYRFYRKLGVFSDAVLKKLETVRGFPLSAMIRVITRKPKWYSLTIEVTSLNEVEKEKKFFEIPEGWNKEENPLRISCYERDCDKMVETANPGGKFRYKGRWVYFCSSKCRRKFVAEYKKRWRGAGTTGRHALKKKQGGKKDRTEE